MLLSSDGKRVIFARMNTDKNSHTSPRTPFGRTSVIIFFKENILFSLFTAVTSSCTSQPHRRQPLVTSLIWPPDNLFHWIAPTHRTFTIQKQRLLKTVIYTGVITSFASGDFSGDHAFQISSGIQHKQTNQRTAVTHTRVELPPPKNSQLPPKRRSTRKREKLYNHVKKTATSSFLIRCHVPH